MSEQDTQTPVAQPDQPTLTLADLTLTLNVIQTVAQRGAVRADELSTVGGLYDRLFKFLQAQGAITTQAPAAEAPTTDAPASETQGE